MRPSSTTGTTREHLPERLSAPGFLDAARYEALRGGPRYLAVYELDSVEAAPVGRVPADEPQSYRVDEKDVAQRGGPQCDSERLYPDLPGGE